MEPYQELERAWAEFNGLNPAGMVCCSSGTAALHLALEALRLPPGSEVLVPDLTMIACPRAVTLVGLTPVFVDCDERLLMSQEPYTSCLMGSEWYPNSISAVMAVHLYGRKQDMEELHYWTNRRQGTCKVVEDLAEAHGVRPHEDTDAACWSFYRNKVVAGEEGGAVWFRDPEYTALARQLRSLGFTDAHDFWHVPRGHNYRMSNVHAELVNDSLRKYKTNLRRRRQLEKWYDEQCPSEWRMPPRDVPWVYDLRVPGLNWEKQDEVVRELQKEGVAVRHCFKPCHMQREYAGTRIIEPESCRALLGVAGHRSRSTVASQEVVYLPIVPGVTQRADCVRAFTVLRDALGNPSSSRQDASGRSG